MKAWPGVRLVATSAPSALRLDAVDEALHHRQRDVGLEQRHAHLAQRLGDVLFGDAAAAAQASMLRARRSVRLSNMGGSAWEVANLIIGARRAACAAPDPHSPLCVVAPML